MIQAQSQINYQYLEFYLFNFFVSSGYNLFIVLVNLKGVFSEKKKEVFTNICIKLGSRLLPKENL